jgi:Flp pilus assembly protein TadD
MYLEALDASGRHDLVLDAIAIGLQHSRSPRLVMHEALLLDETGRHADAMTAMREAADGGEPRAMANLAKWLLDANRIDDALGYARRATEAMPTYANGQRMHGKVALAANQPDEALAAFERAYTIEPAPGNQLNVGLALVTLHRVDDARRYLEPLLLDPEFAPRARGLLGR